MALERGSSLVRSVSSEFCLVSYFSTTQTRLDDDRVDWPPWSGDWSAHFFTLSI